MKLIIAGSRSISNQEAWLNLCKTCVKLKFHGDEPERSATVTEVVSGGCRGVDRLGEDWAVKEHIPIKVFPANWGKHGRAAGPIRNKQMAEYADALLLFWDGKSKGSASMKREMESLNKPVHEIIIEGG